MTRKERFERLCEEVFGEVPSEDGRFDYSGPEDAVEYLYDPENDWPHRYVLVTTGGEYGYLYPVESIEHIAEKLGFVCGDSTYGEGPSYIADLDTGETLWPQWETLQWSQKSLAPTARPQ